MILARSPNLSSFSIRSRDVMEGSKYSKELEQLRKYQTRFFKNLLIRATDSEQTYYGLMTMAAAEYPNGADPRSVS